MSEKYKTEEIKMTIKTISKRMLSLLMALLMLCSGMAVAFATETKQVPAPVFTADNENRTITVAKPAAIMVDGVEYPVSISIAPTAAEPQTLADGSLFFYGLSAGTKYTITASVTLEGYTAGTATHTFKTKPAAPASPVATKIAATSITINSVSGCEYMLATKAGETVFAWGSKTTFDNLTANTEYVVSIRVKETEKAYASDAASIKVTTLLAPKGKAEAPVLVDKTETSITVNAVNVPEGETVEFSINNGSTWQTAGKFTGLKKDTAYTIVARYTYNKDAQEASPVSDALQVKTNARAGYTADIKKTTFKVDGDNYANESITLVVTGDVPANMIELQYGDTKIVPEKFSYDSGANKYGPSSSDGNTYKFSFVPGVENANSKMEVVVYFTEYKYDGSKWVESRPLTKVYDVEIGANNDFFNKLKEGFESFLNLLLNTIPGYINDFFNSDAIGKGMDFFTNLFKNLDMDALLGAIK